jgi:hypothetical protein
VLQRYVFTVGDGRFRWFVNSIGLDDNTFLPATRNFQVRLSGCAAAFVNASVTAGAGPVKIIPGQYQAPVSEYVFPEPAGSGAPINAFNFGDLPFLVITRFYLL